jgi:hypothetical protein
LRTVFGTHTTTSAVVAGSEYIALCKLPRGARVVSAEFIVPASVGTTAGNLGVYTIGNDGTLTIVGTGNQISAAADAVTLATAGRKQLIAVQGRATYKTTTDVALVYAPTATNFATAITFDYIIEYVVD